jgi:hypothetical protein
MDDRDDDEVEGIEESVPMYMVDEETRDLIEAALNCMISLSEAQVNPDSAEGILGIADSLAIRFGISRIEVEQELHTTEDGDEVIYRPKDSIFKSKLLDDDEEAGPTGT